MTSTPTATSTRRAQNVAASAPPLRTDASPGRPRGWLRHLGDQRRTRWLRRALWPLALAAGVGVMAMTVANDGFDGIDTTRILGVLVGWAFAGSGLYAWGRRPGHRLGPLMTAVGCSYLGAQILLQAHSSPLFTGGMWLADAWTVILVLFLLSVPDGRLKTRRDLVVIAMFATVAFPLELLWLLCFDPGGSPGNALLVWPDAGVAGNVDSAQRALVMFASVVLAVELSRRWIVASPPVRRTLMPVLAGAAALLLGSALTALDKLHVEFAPARWVVLGAFIAMPLAVLAVILRARLARSAVGDLLVELGPGSAPADLQDALARALRDPSLGLVYWLPEFGTYADLEGRRSELPEASGERAMTLIDRNGAHLAALLHDRSLNDEPELLAAVTATAGIALENARLHVELRARLEELRGSRARVFEVSRRERQRLERDLHDGAQQRLVALSLELGLLEEQLADNPDLTAQLAEARREIAVSLDELRAVARGIHPAVVSGHGLAVALEQLAARAPVPVELAVRIEGRLPEALEVAAYYLVTESLANVGKHAQASSVTIEVVQTSGEVVIQVVDDGIGGADTERGSGLRGLADRVEALGGRLRVWSPHGGGTRVRAEIPCAS